VGFGASARPPDEARELLLAGRFGSPDDASLDFVAVARGGPAATMWAPLTEAGLAGARPATHEAATAARLVTPTMTDVVFLTS